MSESNYSGMQLAREAKLLTPLIGFLVLRRLKLLPQWLLEGTALVVSFRLCVSYFRTGVKGLANDALTFVTMLPGMDRVIKRIMDNEVKSAMKTLGGSSDGEDESTQSESNDGGDGVKPAQLKIPEKGIDRKELLEAMKVDKNNDGRYTEAGKAFALVYASEDDAIFREHAELQTALVETFGKLQTLPDKARMANSIAMQKFLHTNALNPMMFPSLLKYENETVSMTADLLNGDSSVVGALTSGGTESILMAVKAYRQRARRLRPYITKPNMVIPDTAHPAFHKAGHYFDVEMVLAAVDEVTMQCDPNDIDRLVDHNTIAIACSAPQYAHCIVDPVEQVSNVARKHSLPLHVDACYGGYALPWIERLGYKIPLWDFRVKGVTSISADIHKWGFMMKGASCILFKNEDYRRDMYYAYSGWCGGLYASPTVTGTRPGYAIACAWATLKSFGADGYTSQARQIMDAVENLRSRIEQIDGVAPAVERKHQTPMAGFAVKSTSRDIDIFAVADVMETKGWKMERQPGVKNIPATLHFSIMPMHAQKGHMEQLGNDLRASVEVVKNDKELGNKGSAAIYGMVASAPNGGLIDDFLVNFFSELYKMKG